MPNYILVLLAAFVLAYGTTPLARRVAAVLGVVDVPSPRKVHAVSVPMLGGVAIYLAFVVALLLFSESHFIAQFINILIGATLVSLLGVWDDSRGLRPLLKLLGQVLIASLLVASGVQVAFLPHPWLNVAATLLWIVSITNALNLLDNMDGLSGGVAAVAGGFFLLLAATNGQYLVATLAAAVTGACVGFLRYNLNPAWIFMGDAGSLFLGYILAVIGIKLRFPGNIDTVTWMVPILVLGLPIFDTTLVVVSRLRRGLNPFLTPGRDHVSHRLVQLGLSHRGAVIVLYIVGVALGMAALAVANATIVEAYLIGGLVFLMGLATFLVLERVPVAEIEGQK